MLCKTPTTIEGLPREALRGPTPRIYRDRRHGTATLVTRQSRLRRQFAQALPEGPEKVLGIGTHGDDLWAVQAPLEEAERALRQLGWTAGAESSPAEDRDPKARAHRRLCGARGRRTPRR